MIMVHACMQKSYVHAYMVCPHHSDTTYMFCQWVVVDGSSPGYSVVFSWVFSEIPFQSELMPAK